MRILLSVILLLGLGAIYAYAAIAEGTFGRDTVVRSVNASTYFLNYHGTVYNLTEVLTNVTITPVSEWGLVLGTTGDWFNYSGLSGATPVYIGLQVHPDNVTLGVLPQVYDKDATHWQLALYWYNGTQYNKGDVLVMYHAHIDWDNPTGETYIEANEQT